MLNIAAALSRNNLALFQTLFLQIVPEPTTNPMALIQLPHGL